jgi:hypothetical protein
VTFNDEGLPFVDLRDCTNRDVVRRVSAFLDEITLDAIRADAAHLVLADAPCDVIARRIATTRIDHLGRKMAALEAVVQLLEDLRTPTNEEN